jgi:polar amino acid transport system substrate-binding protein
MFPRKMPDSAKLRDQFNQQLQHAIASGRYQTYFERLARGDY